MVAQCRARQKRAVARLAGRIDIVTDLVTSSLSGVSDQASAKLGRAVSRSAARVQADCEVRPAAMLRFQRAVRQLATPALDRRSLRDLRRAYATWTAVVGGEWRASTLKYKLALCRTYDKPIRASYSVRTGPALYGKDMWVNWTLHNGTDRTVVVNQSGELWARGVFPAYRGEWDRRRQAWSFMWGGSSADPELWLRPGKQGTARVGVGIGYLPMRADGEIVEVRPYLLVRPAKPGKLYASCAVPVRAGP